MILTATAGRSFLSAVPVIIPAFLPAGFTGSLVVAEFDSLEAAQAWAEADPYIEAGVYESVVVKPYKKVLP